MIMRIDYQFTLAGRTFRSPGADIGESTDKDWFAADALRDTKWSAVHHAMPSFFEAIEEYYEDISQVEPKQFGIKFEYIEEGE